MARVHSIYGELNDLQEQAGTALRHSRAGTSTSLPAEPSSQASNCSDLSSAGMRSCTSATKRFGSVMTMVQERIVSPDFLSCH